MCSRLLGQGSKEVSLDVPPLTHWQRQTQLPAVLLPSNTAEPERGQEQSPMSKSTLIPVSLLVLMSGACKAPLLCSQQRFGHEQGWGSGMEMGRQRWGTALAVGQHLPCSSQEFLQPPPGAPHPSFGLLSCSQSWWQGFVVQGDGLLASP